MYSIPVTERLKKLSAHYGVFITLPFSRFEDGVATVQIEVVGMGRFEASASGPCPEATRIEAIDNAIASSPLCEEG